MREGILKSSRTKDKYIDIDYNLSKEKIIKLYNNLYNLKWEIWPKFWPKIF